VRGAIFAVPALAVLASLAGCETLTRESTQQLQIEALDGHDRPVPGLTCRVGDAPSTFTLPAAGVVVRRSGANLQIDCRHGSDVATATVVPRRDGLEQALVPFGSVAVFVDHLSGKLYEYPTVLRLRVGQHVTLEHGGQARIVKAEPLPGAATVIARADPAPAAATAPVAARTKPHPAPAPVLAAADPTLGTVRPAAPPNW
jgi:hypothetical protein